MESFWPSSPRSKYRTTLTSSSIYQASYNRNVRQVDYSFSHLGRNSAASLQSRYLHSNSNNYKSRSRKCAIFTFVAIALGIIAVLALIGLAVYMKTIQTDTSSQTLTFGCSVKVSKGDRFASHLKEKMRKYQQQLDTLYRRSNLGSAVTSVIVDRFGEDTVTIFYKILINRKKLTRTTSNLEKMLKDILVTDSVSRNPVFRSVKFDVKSIQVKQILNTDNLNNKVITKAKESKQKGDILLINKPNLTVAEESPVRKSPILEEPTFKNEELSVIQGSFQISKTEADITEKKDGPSDSFTYKSKTERVKPPPKLTTKPPVIVSAFVNINPVDKSPTTSTSENPKQTSTSTPIVTTLANLKSTTNLFSNPITSFPFSFDQEPWIPIQRETEYSQNPKTSLNFDSSSTVSSIEILHKKQPVYTSFTVPGLTHHSINTENLGGIGIFGHPLPVNKIAGITDAPTTEKYQDDTTKSYPSSEDFVEIETVKHVPNLLEQKLNTKSFDTKTENYDSSTAPQELTSEKHIANTLRSYFDSNRNSIYQNLSNLFPFTNSTLLTKELLTSTQSTVRKLDENIEDEDSVVGEGQVEVVEDDEKSLMMKTETITKLPLVTLIPVKSNSGVGRPLRPRPKIDNVVENRSFPSDPFYKNVNLDFTQISKSPIKYVQTEVVTSVSSEINRVKINKNRLHDFKISNILNFETERSLIESTTANVGNKIKKLITKNNIAENETDLRNPKMDPKNNFTINEQLPGFNNNIKIDNNEVVVFSVNSSTSSTKNKKINNNVLSDEKLKQLSIISKLNSNSSNDEAETVISNKAISASYTINEAGFKVLTKTLNKIPSFFKDEEMKSIGNFNGIIELNKSECNNLTIKCGNGQCLPISTRCNQLIDCNDGVDEKNCSCADYLKSQNLFKKICDGVVDCWDYSDENLCEWCQVDQYVCANSKHCINKSQICDNINDCPNGDDERQCVSIASSAKAAEEFRYHSEGYLMVRKNGIWQKVCADNFENITNTNSWWKLSDLGEAVCKSLTYQKQKYIKIVTEFDPPSANNRFYEISYASSNITKANLMFEEGLCTNRNIVKLKCENLECGTRPQAVNQIARIVGGGNAGLGSWPWQTALYKEGEFQCGATLISSRWLISAGHCFFRSLDEHWVARLGALRRGSTLPSPYEQLRPIIKIVIHSGYIDTGFINDISLLQMESPIVFSDYVRPICLPSADSVLRDGKICTVIGWGQLFEVGRIFPDTLQEVQVPVISTEECHRRTLLLPLYKVTDDMFCAGYERGGRDACLGDSGGPLMCSESDGRWVLQGVTSNGYGCARANRPGVYTKVANYLSWINSHINGTNSETTLKSNCSGYRCPLGECLPKSRICNGYIECSDGSDEQNCSRLIK